jgi:hypothetical protein
VDERDTEKPPGWAGFKAKTLLTTANDTTQSANLPAASTDWFEFVADLCDTQALWFGYGSTRLFVTSQRHPASLLLDAEVRIFPPP